MAVLVVAAGAALGADKAPAADKSTEAKPPAAEQSIILKAVRKPVPGEKVWTNEDLAKLSHEGPWATEPVGPGATEASAAPAALPNPLDYLANEEKQAQARKERLAQAQTDVDVARANVKALETQLLAVVNPFAPRPKLSDKEKEYRAESGETAEQRYQRTQKELEEAKAKLTTAEGKLDQAKQGDKKR